MTVKAFAKVNLTLEVLGRRPDGYHALRSVVAPIALHDVVRIEPTRDGLVASDSEYGESDLCVKAARALKDAAGLYAAGARISTVKNVPAGGGLGGGSADAAAVVLALDGAWGLDLPLERLCEIGAEVGSDVPALVVGQRLRAPVLMEGRGEKTTPMRPEEAIEFCGCGGRHIVLANPGVASSTAEVYARCKPRGRAAGGALPYNDLEAAARALHPEIAAAAEALAAAGAAAVRMSGSGSTVFGFAETAEDAERIASAAAATGLKCRATRPLWLAEQD